MPHNRLLWPLFVVRAADVLLCTCIDVLNGIDVLADLVALRVQWRVPGIRM